MLAQRITAIALGYEDLNDHQDPPRPIPSSRSPPGHPPTPTRTFASPPTLCRLENRVDRKALIRIAGILVDQFVAAHPTPPEHLTLDFDATDDPIHGHQERRFFHGYYDHHCFLPLYVFCGDELLTAYLRPSDIDAAKHARAVLKLLVRKLRSAWPEVKITIRGDSGFCRWRLMRWCDSHGIGYVLGLARNPALQRAARDEIERAERQFRADRSAATDLRLVLLRGGELGPDPAGDRQGRAQRPGGQSAIRRRQRPGRSAGVI